MQTKHRVLLVSDMHYTTEETHDQLKLICPTANTSAAAGDALGHTQREKIEKIYEAVVCENQRAPLDAVLVLGDLSVDDYDFRNLPVNYCKKFKEDCMDRLPCPTYAMPGNHDSYPDGIWKEVFGHGRQFDVEIGDAVFLMADVYHTTPASGASGSPATPFDADYLRKKLEQYHGRRIFLCAHHITERLFTDETKEIIRTAKDLICLFRGHVHKNSVYNLGTEFGYKTLIDIGGYGYQCLHIEKKWIFSEFDFAYAWGYQIVEWDDQAVRTYHVKPKMYYVGTNGVFDVEETVEGEKYFQ